MARTVLVTGGNRGIGLAIAQAFAAQGDRVALHYGRNREKAEALAAELPGDGHVAVGADLADAEQVRSMVQAAAGALGAIDEASYEDWQRSWADTLGINLVGAANAAFCALPHMGRGGRMVFVASRGAFRGEPDHPAYGASKAGMISLAQSLARRLGPRGIAVTAVAPGFVETDMAADALTGAEGDRRRAESPLGRVARPEEVAAAVRYLASPEAEMASGSVIDVNGASFLRM